MKTLNDNINDIPIKKFIQESTQKHKLIPFIGAGFSANIAKYPSWKKFMDILEDDLNEDSGNDQIKFASMSRNDDQAELTQYFYWYKGEDNGSNNIDILKEGKKKFKQLVYSKFKAADYNEDTFKQHEILIKKFQKIYTTNWDDLLEYTCMKCKDPFGYSRLTAPHGKSWWGGRYVEKVEQKIVKSKEKREIIKFHGCLHDTSVTTIVASTADYFERISVIRQHPLDIKISYDMRENHFLFIGYSLSDINIRYILNQIIFQRWEKDHTEDQKYFFIITFDNPEVCSKYEEVYLEKCNYIIPITLCPAEHKLHSFTKQIDDIEKDESKSEEKRKTIIDPLDKEVKRIYKTEICKFLNEI